MNLKPIEFKANDKNWVGMCITAPQLISLVNRFLYIIDKIDDCYQIHFFDYTKPTNAGYLIDHLTNNSYKFDTLEDAIEYAQQHELQMQEILAIEVERFNKDYQEYLESRKQNNV